MKLTHAFFLATIAFASVTLAVDGIVVTTVASNAHTPVGGGWRGDIARWDIKDSKVVKRDTLHRSSAGVSHSPCISMDGKRVVFFRDGDTYTLIPGDADDKGKYKAGSKDFITIMNIDGSNKRDIVEFTGAITNDIFYRAGYDRLIDWPKGDWVYYQKPQSYEVWRVNVSP